MKYYLVRVSDMENNTLENKAWTDLKSAKRFINNAAHLRCLKHKYKDEGSNCNCRIYTMYKIDEKLVEKKEWGNV